MKKKKKVLIVDDSAFMRISLRTLLENHGFEVVGEADDGVTAIRKYKECRPDIVTMDITMPECNGIEALKEIKQFDPNAAIVMISTMGQENLVKEAVISGAKTFLVKPFTEDRVVRTLTDFACVG